MEGEVLYCFSFSKKQGNDKGIFLWILKLKDLM